MPPTGATVRVKGYREFLIACDNADRETKYRVRNTLRQAGAVVQRSATGKFSPYDLGSALAYRTVVRRRGISVEQPRRRTTGKHPEFGALQMRRALVPALSENENETVRALEDALDKIADHFERVP